MGQPVVHFEIIGRDPMRLRSYYGDLFGWEFDAGDAATEAVSQSGNYGFVDGNTSGGGINGGVGEIGSRMPGIPVPTATAPRSGSSHKPPH